MDEIEVPDREDAACALDTVEARLVRQGQYDAACDVISAQRRIRLDDDEIRWLESRIAELEAMVVWVSRAMTLAGEGSTDADILRAVKEVYDAAS